MDPRENQFRQHEMSHQRQEEREAAERRIRQGDQPWREEAGVMSVVDAVRDVQFPASVDELVEKAGDRAVRTSNDVELPLAHILPKLKRREFMGVRDFEDEVVRHWRGIETAETPANQRGGSSQTMPPGVDLD